MTLGATIADAQYHCSAPTHNQWLTRASGVATERHLPEEQVRSVSQELEATIELLASKSSVQLSDAQVLRFTGQKTIAAGDRHPFLIRAVFPVAKPKLDVFLNGDALEVSASGLGCAPYVMHPIVVFLERAPTQVFVTAAAAL
jgi:hypothetical protein